MAMQQANKLLPELLPRREIMDPRVSTIEAELSADATWPAEESIPLGPWRLRANRGYTNRANSVRTAGDDSDNYDWEELIAGAEKFYRARNLPPIFHITPASAPRDLDQRLTARGYRAEKSSNVWGADSESLCRAIAEPDSNMELLRSNSPTEDWLRPDVHADRAHSLDQLCRRIAEPRILVSVVESNQTVARALSAIHGGVAWLYCMATLPSHQRRGHATRLIHCLAEWAVGNNAGAFYLQVMTDNAAAKSLYTRAGFSWRYDYHYRALR
jgi:GNAT superfamily N-acetyltransferase